MKISDLMLKLNNQGFTMLDTLDDIPTIEKQMLELRRRAVFESFFGTTPTDSGMRSWEWHLTMAQDQFKNKEIQSEIDYILEDKYLDHTEKATEGFLNKILVN
jgi:hypothetical protein